MVLFRFAHKVIVNIFQSQQLMNEYQPEDLNFDLAQEFSLLKQLVSLSFLVETISLLMAIHITLDEFRFVQQGHDPCLAKKLAHDISFKTHHTAQNHLSEQNKKELDEFLSFLK
jgi:hypothetical protein